MPTTLLTTLTHTTRQNFTKTVRETTIITTTKTVTPTIAIEKPMTEDFINILKNSCFLIIMSSIAMLLAAILVVISMIKFRKMFFT